MTPNLSIESRAENRSESRSANRAENRFEKRLSPRVLVAHPRPPETYLRALDLVSLGYDCSLSPENLNAYGGLLLVGGGDVLPAFYRGDVPARNVNFVKDKLEFDLLDYFVGKGLPVLAICRGFQLVNVFFGGTLKNVNGHSGKTDVYHPVSACGKIFGGLDRVNSAHCQAVDIVPDEAKIVAVAPDLTIEATIYGENIVCAQFHPERMERSVTEKIFGAFAAAVRKSAAF